MKGSKDASGKLKTLPHLSPSDLARATGGDNDTDWDWSGFDFGEWSGFDFGEYNNPLPDPWDSGDSI